MRCFAAIRCMMDFAARASISSSSRSITGRYGIDIRWNRSTGAADDRETLDCAPDEGERATIYLMTDLGEAIPLHDAAPGPDGGAEAARIVAETYRVLAQRGAA